MTKEQLQQFAETLRTGRAKLDLNKAEFCQKAGITPNTLRALERGAQHPNPETIDRLAHVLGMTTTAITSGKRVVDASDPLLANLNDEDLEVAQLFHHAPMRVKERTLGVLQEPVRRSRPDPATSHVGSTMSEQMTKLDPENRHMVTTLVARLIERQRDETTATKDAPPVRVPRGKLGA